MMTLPQLCRANDLPLDQVRHLLRTAPELARVGAFVGATRVFVQSEVKKIKDAFEARQKRDRVTV